MPRSHTASLLSRRRSLPRLELLESRELLSSNLGTQLLQPTGRILLQNSGIGLNQPNATIGRAIFNPSQMRTAYGLNQVANQGQGMTVAIVDAFGDPNITTDLSIFSSQFGLPQMNGVGGNPTFQILIPPGQVSNPPLPGNPWPGEISLDVEWVHSMAPLANIDLVITQDNSTDALYGAEVDGQPFQSGVGYAKTLPGVVVVSNSYGGGERSTEAKYDPAFTTPNNNVAFTFSTGDNGAPPSYPAASPNVVAVGGTSLNTVGVRGAYGFEAGWSGSGGGVSAFEATPAFQSGNGVDLGGRSNPDVSMDADPNTGVLVIDQFDDPGFFLVFGGTSLSSPMFASVIAIADQGRIGGGGQALSSVGVNQAMYGAYSSVNYLTYFHDITTGNNGFAAGVGYDLVTGIGSPKAQNLIPLLVGAAPAAAVGLGGGGSGIGIPGLGTNGFAAGVVQIGSPVATLANGSATSQLTPSPSAFGLAGLRTGLTVNATTAALLPQGPAARVASDVTALPVHTTVTLEGFRGTVEVTPAGAALPATADELGSPEFSGEALTPAAVPAANLNEVTIPATAGVGASDAVFAELSVAPLSNRSATPAVAVVSGEESNSVDLAMVAGMALALGGSWSTLARGEETRKNPALRN
jgi:hypothetical protein